MMVKRRQTPPLLQRGTEMTEHKILIENENQANAVVAKVMRLTFLIFTLIYLLNLTGIFVIVRRS